MDAGHESDPDHPSFRADRARRIVARDGRAHTTRPLKSERWSFKKFLYENGLTLTLMALFLLTLFGQVVAGLRDHNDNQREHGQPTVWLGEYLISGHFLEA